ncbi:MAG: hypothetical protein DMD96_02045 [Candidatus Rokuibacteriota bacterium]|nr:MAG: hypothetical protein DMD96_02045 [Candidatus Rokubacteria bacterium]
MDLLADLEEFVHDHSPHGTMTGDEPASDGIGRSATAAASMRFLTRTVPHVAFPCRAGML